VHGAAIIRRLSPTSPQTGSEVNFGAEHLREGYKAVGNPGYASLLRGRVIWSLLKLPVQVRMPGDVQTLRLAEELEA
jgi:hypothetical protein